MIATPTHATLLLAHGLDPGPCPCRRRLVPLGAYWALAAGPARAAPVALGGAHEVYLCRVCDEGLDAGPGGLDRFRYSTAFKPIPPGGGHDR